MLNLTVFFFTCKNEFLRKKNYERVFRYKYREIPLKLEFKKFLRNVIWYPWKKYFSIPLVQNIENTF